MPFQVPCQICGTILKRPWNPSNGRRATCPGPCLSELRRRTGLQIAADGKVPKLTPEIQRLAAIGRTGKGKGWESAGYRGLRHDGRNVLEHRLIMEREIGRPLRPEEVVHHINHDTLDNRIENLRLYANRSEHFRHGHPELAQRRKSKVLEATCAECGCTFRTPDTSKRQTLCRKHRRYQRRYI